MLPADASQAARLFFNRLMESLPDQVYFKDLEGRFICVNQTQARFLGLQSPEEALGKTDFDFFERELAAIKDADEREIIRSGVGFVDKEELSTGIGGNVRWTLSSKLPLFDDEGATIGTFGISRDISEMKEARAALDAHHRLVSTLIEILPCRIFVKDRQGRIQLTNEAYRSALGFKQPKELLGRRLSEIVVGERSRRYADDDQAVLEKGVSILNREDYDASPIGDKRWLLLSKVPLRDAKGQVDGIVGMAADITAQKSAEARAVEAQRDLAEKNQQIEGELALASELQTELMASSVQSVRDELDASSPFMPRIGSFYVPSAHLAGDFFQLLPLSDHTFGLLMCDVMGHGVKAALVTTLIRGLLVNLKAEELDPAEVLEQLNERLCPLLDRPPLPRFVTALYATVDARAGRVRLASAGHPWPLHQRADGPAGAISLEQCGPALGLIRGATYKSAEHEVAAGDRLLLFTDGWTEETNTAGEEFGCGRMASAMAHCPSKDPAEVLECVARAMRAYTGSTVHNDDLCAVLACF